MKTMVAISPTPNRVSDRIYRICKTDSTPNRVSNPVGVIAGGGRAAGSFQPRRVGCKKSSFLQK
jgi:hypothetical protein